MAAIAPMHSVKTVMVLVILPGTVKRKFPHQEHLITMIDHTPTHVMIATVGTDYNLSTADAARETASTGQDHTIKLNTAEAPATARG